MKLAKINLYNRLNTLQNGILDPIQNAKSVKSILSIIDSNFPNLINWELDKKYQPHEAQSQSWIVQNF